MKLIFLVLWSSLSFAGSTCYEMCQTHSLPYEQCIEEQCPTTPQDWGVTCYAGESQLFHLNIDVIEKLPSSFFFIKKYKVNGVTLSGPRMQGHEFEEVMTESKISTRTHTGYNYGLNVANYGTISLSEIDFSHLPEHFPVGFYGTLKLDNQQGQIPLSCIKN